MDLQGLLGQVLEGNNLGAISQSIGADQSTTSTASQAALPMILGALARNASTPDGAGALAGALGRDHDGSILSDIAGAVLGGQAASIGGGILGHVFGNRQPAVEQGISQASGLDAGTVGKLLVTLAPIVMGAIGNTQRQQGLDPAALAGMLGQQQEQMQETHSPVMGMLSAVLDSNHDGSMVDDVIRLAGGFLGRR